MIVVIFSSAYLSTSMDAFIKEEDDEDTEMTSRLVVDEAATAVSVPTT